VEKQIIENCVKLFTRLECRDYCRFDFRLDGSGAPRLLEVNPNPGWCWDGHMAKMGRLINISYSRLLEMILQAAELRIAQNKTEVLQTNLAGNEVTSLPVM
jgi:D-alanine-D-alanine ligase